MTKVGLYGLTEQFEEFTVLMGYLLGRVGILAVPPRNVTDQIPNPTKRPPKTSLSEAEREAITGLLKDDIRFYREAVKEYERRISDPRVQAVFADAVPLVRSCRAAVDRLQAIKDPGGIRAVAPLIASEQRTRNHGRRGVSVGGVLALTALGPLDNFSPDRAAMNPLPGASH